MNFHPQRTVRRVTIVLLITGILAVLSLASGQFHQTRASSATMYSVTDLGTLGGTFSGAGAINNRGEVTGISAFAGDVALRGFIWKNGVMTDLGTLGGQNSATENRGLNNRGQVAGAAETATVDPTSATGSLEFHAFLWRQGKMIDLGTLGGAPGSFAYAINDHGQVVGENITNVQTFMSNEAGQGFIWQDGKMRILGTLEGTTSSPHAINNRGQVAGGSSLPGDVTQHAFLLQDGHMADLGTLPGDVFSEATAITEQGQVLGLSCSSKGCRATLWDKSTVIDLNTLISPASGWQLTDAEAENSRGQIVGGGLHNGLFRAFLLTPVH
ncbi:MAG: hypothetical protein ACJ8CB_17910 [Ktedonobacteraceae bacterium]